MAEFNILETLELVGKAKTREEKRQVLDELLQIGRASCRERV